MKPVLMLLGLTLVLTFGAITAVQSYTPAAAGTVGDSSSDDDDIGTCRDDGDDGAEEPDLPDNPDSEDNQGPEELGGAVVFTQAPEEVGDQPDDPSHEWDDNCERATEPGGVMGESATPCPTFVGVEVSGDPCCPAPTEVNGELIDPCLCLFSGGGEVDAEGPGICCIIFPFFCCDSAEVGPEGCFPPCFPICLPSADVDCDGEVTAADAFESLVQLSGAATTVEAEGCASGGDADCSGALDAMDTLAILRILAGVDAPATC